MRIEEIYSAEELTELAKARFQEERKMGKGMIYFVIVKR